MKAVVVEGLAVALAGSLFALAANQVSPRGLQLSRNYFPKAATVATNQTTGTEAVAGVSNQVSEVLQRLESKGLRPVDTQQAFALFQDPRYQQSLVMFIDARDETHYKAGHIPGAYELYYYRPENHLPVVLPACQVAEQIVVYCNGGDCEDSEFTAILLRDSGVSPEKLYVYTGGIADWSANGFPVETGARLSGTISPAAKTK